MTREMLARGFLWLAVVGWGTGFGAKLFDLIIIAGAWGASPPASLVLMPYGPRYPLNPGDFFLPLMALMVPGTFGALFSGWKTPWRYRIWLIVPLVAFVLTAVFTPAVFWPMIRELYGAGIGRIDRSEAELVLLVRRWFVWDWLRTIVSGIGFLSYIRAISVPFPTNGR